MAAPGHCCPIPVHHRPSRIGAGGSSHDQADRTIGHLHRRPGRIEGELQESLGMAAIQSALLRSHQRVRQRKSEDREPADTAGPCKVPSRRRTRR